jgi:hypothetical protein
MTPREAFKLGFLQKCAADGLSQEAVLARIRSAKLMAGDPKLLKEASVLGTALKTLATPIGGGLLTGGVLGLGGGALLANATNANYDADEAKKREELAEYQRALQAMKQLHERQQLGVE